MLLAAFEKATPSMPAKVPYSIEGCSLPVAAADEIPSAQATNEHAGSSLVRNVVVFDQAACPEQAPNIPYCVLAADTSHLGDALQHNRQPIIAQQAAQIDRDALSNGQLQGNSSYDMAFAQEVIEKCPMQRRSTFRHQIRPRILANERLCIRHNDSSLRSAVGCSEETSRVRFVEGPAPHISGRPQLYGHLFQGQPPPLHWHLEVRSPHNRLSVTVLCCCHLCYCVTLMLAAMACRARIEQLMSELVEAAPTPSAARPSILASMRGQGRPGHVERVIMHLVGLTYGSCASYLHTSSSLCAIAVAVAAQWQFLA